MNHSYTVRNGNIRIVPMSCEGSEMYRQLRNKEENRSFFYRFHHIRRRAENMVRKISEG